jgi:chemotaxis protein MotB
VAYADFVTAMMAFFLLMWLLSMADPVQRQALQDYFNEYSVFESGGSPFVTTPFSNGTEKNGELIKIFDGSPKGMKQNGTPGLEGGGQGDQSEKPIAAQDDDLTADQIRENIDWLFEQQLGDLKGSVAVEVVGDTVRIEIMDRDAEPMFKPGSTYLTPAGLKVLEVTANYLRTVNRKIAIGGHTDGSPFGNSSYSNWELSTERANSARRALEKSGLDRDRLLRVSGHANTEPRFRENPRDPRNRRVTITILNQRSVNAWQLGADGSESQWYLDRRPDPVNRTVPAPAPEAPAAPEAPGDGEAAPPAGSP